MADTRHERAVASLIDLENEYGQITPEQLVEYAADPQSPLHPYFEWNDEVAGHAYRIDQARTLLRSVRVEVQRPNTSVSVVRYVHDSRADHNQGYVNIAKVEVAGLTDSTIQAEINRTVALIRRGRNIAAVLEREQEFIVAIAAALR